MAKLPEGVTFRFRDGGSAVRYIVPPSDIDALFEIEARVTVQPDGSVWYGKWYEGLDCQGQILVIVENGEAAVYTFDWSLNSMNVLQKVLAALTPPPPRREPEGGGGAPAHPVGPVPARPAGDRKRPPVPWLTGPKDIN